MALDIVILAAGQGKRMHSQKSKVLHSLGGKPLLGHVLDTAQKLNSVGATIVVYGHQGEEVRNAFSHRDITWVEQSQQLGTGHALQQCLTQLSPNHQVLVLYGDVPLVSDTTLKKLLETTKPDQLGMITATLADPTGLGRIIRDNAQNIVDIIEHKDLGPAQQNLQEINSGIYLFPAKFLAKALPQLQNTNSQKEYYLTDVIKMAVKENIPIKSIQPEYAEEIAGINDRLQLAYLERCYQRQIAKKLMQQGVTLFDPERIDIRGELSVGKDVVIDINVIIEGRVSIGDNCQIGPHSVLRNVSLGDRVNIKAYSLLEDAQVSADCQIGPFARIRPGTVLLEKVLVGNFVEIKNSRIDENAKISHLSYIGDADVGKRVNIGAGTITCNYDGVNKHRTIVEKDAFIGSNTALVAPIRIGEMATVGAGSTLTRNAPPHQLTVSRAKQLSIENWQRPQKKEI